ncbi:hypothetical protein IFR23_17390 [Sphingomonas sp. CFBP 13603]|uniref:hypothetical protein n=1 Tax=Sphingomonas sp. CFBP 13603 TaxID=2774040 RepID=UPI001866E0CA|nr:hypothetical protein [Sphingomonas sp. CFBP 13603]MBE2993775.1 hypothetical protein [Sphingomonas sp. CFBP 13603]
MTRAFNAVIISAMAARRSSMPYQTRLRRRPMRIPTIARSYSDLMARSVPI